MQIIVIVLLIAIWFTLLYIGWSLIAIQKKGTNEIIKALQELSEKLDSKS